MLKPGLFSTVLGKLGVTHLEVQAENIADRDIGIIALQIHPKIGCHKLVKKY